MKKFLIVICACVCTAGIAHACESNQIDINGDGTQCVNGKFAIKTTNLSDGDVFKFNMTAQGTFTVNCGETGTLTSSANDITNGNTITRNNTTQATYTCTYSVGGIKTIAFDGLATGYNSTNVSTILFGGDTSDNITPHLVSEISGSLGKIFPTLGFNSGQHPFWLHTFYNCINLRTLPQDLFYKGSGLSAGAFYETFRGCTNLQSIPENLFSHLTHFVNNQFNGVFWGCSSLVSIPENLFPFNVSAGSSMFASAFRDCIGLTEIPENLFSHITSTGSMMFNYTFSGCRGLTSIPENLFQSVVSANQYAFHSTFANCRGLTSIPEQLFSSITTFGTGVFVYTFSDCRGLTSIPPNLFKNVQTARNSLFYGTFSNCKNLRGYIPPSTFAGLIANGSPTTTNMWYQTFANTGLVNKCPSNTMPYITGYEGTGNTTWNGKVSCQDIVPITCNASEYLSATDGMCHVCTNDNYCPGGTYTYNGNDLGKISCGSGLFSPAGMWEPAQCGRILHVGDGFVYLRATKKTEHALHLDLNHDGVADYFGNMTTLDVPMSRETQRKLKVRMNGVVYSIYDDSVDLSLYE